VNVNADLAPGKIGIGGRRRPIHACYDEIVIIPGEKLAVQQDFVS
jgi:hypothetical protein